MYIPAIENALSHGVAVVAKAAYGVSSFHGMADSSFRQGQIGPGRNGLRDNAFRIYYLQFMIYYCRSLGGLAFCPLNSKSEIINHKFLMEYPVV